MNQVHNHNIDVPRGALMMAGALVLASIAATSVVQIAGIPHSASPELVRAAEGATPVATRNLRFTDRKDGAVIIEDVGTGKNALTIEPGTNSGFIRGVMRGLARERRMNGVGQEPPFTLTLWKDGQLSLTDTVTHRSIELNAFGTSNRATYLALLTKPEVAK